MAVFDYDLGVLGGGAAGLTLASGAAQLGAKVLLIEKEPRLGGDCLHYGCVPSKTLIKTAAVYHLMRTAARFGLPAVNPPPVDFGQVAARIKSVIATIQAHDSVERFCGLGAQVRFGQARFVDQHSVVLEGRRVSAKAWLVATGSSPALPPVPGLAQTPHLTNKDIFHLERLPASLAVLGGGPVALEMAQAFQRLGCQVSVVQRGPQVLSREDQDLADLLLTALQGEGVEFYLGAKLSEVLQVNGRPALRFRDALGQERELRTEALLVALGRRANLAGLGLEDIGVEFDAQGLKLDARLRTRHKHIYGAGDVTGAHQFTHAASYEAGVVLANAVLRLPRRADYTWLPWCTFTDPSLASVGLNEKAAQAAGLEHTVWSQEFVANDRALADGAGRGRLKLILDQKEQPLGVQILGPQAGELINEWVAVLGGGVKLSTLAGLVHPYPTLGEINQRAAAGVMAPKLFSDLVKKGLKLFFNTKGRACSPPKQG